MSRLFNTLVAFFGCFFLLSGVVSALPQGVEKRDVIADVANALKLGFVANINTSITLDSLETNLVTVNFGIKNPLLVELTIERIKSKAGINGTSYASFDYTFPKPVVVPPTKTVNSGEVKNVRLDQGAIASLDIIPLGYLDLLNVDVYLRAATVFGKLGIPMTLEGLKQKNVTAVYNLVL